MREVVFALKRKVCLNCDALAIKCDTSLINMYYVVVVRCPGALFLVSDFAQRDITV
jgi:hypothetical protein